MRVEPRSHPGRTLARPPASLILGRRRISHAREAGEDEDDSERWTIA